MEKKHQQPYSSSKAASTDYKKSQDINAKQFPKSHRRASNNFTKNDQPRKSTTQKTKTFNKIPKPKGQYYGCAKEEPKVVVNGAELGSVMVKGSKKQIKNGNHLLEYNLPPRSVQGGDGYNRYRQNQCYTWRHKYDKDQFLQANCQFVVTAHGDYTEYLINDGHNVDKLVNWNSIEQIIVQSSENLSCPICLYPPVAGKVTRCGHVYCWPCILQYLTFSEEKGPKCPVCYFSVYKEGLRSVKKSIIKENTLNVGDTITFRLMRREKKSLIAMPVCDTPAPVQFLSVSDKYCQQAHSKLLLAQKKDIEDIICVEKEELENELAKQKNFYPDSLTIPFIEQAIKELNDRKENLIADHQNEEKLSQLTINDNNNFEDEENACGNAESRYTDEETDLSTDLCNSNMDSYNQDVSLEEQKFHYFYQAEVGQNVYLYTLNVKMLEAEYGSLENCPLVISGTLLEKEVDSLTEETRKRMRYLGHLPVTSQIEFIEIDLQPFVSNQVIKSFQAQLNERQYQRKRNERKELKREKKIAEKENKLMGKFPPPNVHIDSVEHFPTIHYESEWNDSYVILASPTESVTSSISNSPVTNTSFDEFVAGRQTNSWSPPSNQNQSFAQMLQSKNRATVWPSLNTSKKTEAKFSPPANHQPTVSVDPDMEEYAPPTHNPLSDVVAQAMENAALLNIEGAKNDNIPGKKKKKRPKATLVYTTNMARAS